MRDGTKVRNFRTRQDIDIQLSLKVEIKLFRFDKSKANMVCLSYIMNATESGHNKVQK